MFAGMDLYYADPAQRLRTAGEALLWMVYVDHDMSEM